MALRSLGCLVRGSMRARSRFSSPGMAASGGADRLQSLRNALFYSDGRKSVAAAAGASAFAGSRFLHSRAAAQTTKMVRRCDGSSLPGIVVQGPLGSQSGRGARRFHDLRDVVVEHADGATATLSVVIFSVIAGILHSMEDTDDELDEASKEENPTKTPYLRSNQLREEMKREMASYNKAMPDEKAVVREYMEEDQAMRARFEEWMETYGRTYKDEVEKARRFKIFKSRARFTDAFNDDASKAGCSARFGLNEYSDWNAEEIARLSGIPAWRGGGYFKMVLSYLAPQEIWHQVGSAKNKEYED